MSTAHDPMRERITLHGLGFIQVLLPASQRLHIWHPDLPRRACFKDSSIHNHRFGFVSHVLVGSLRNVDYHAAPAADGSHMAYTHEGPRTPNGGRPWTPAERVVLDAIVDWVYHAGEDYRMRAYDYHHTEALGDGKAATLMIKKQVGMEPSRSICRIGTEPDSDFDRFQLSPAQLWTFVFEVLGADAQVVGTIQRIALEHSAADQLPGSPEGLTPSPVEAQQ